MTPATPINAAEAIVEPFWDPHLSQLDQWTVESPVDGTVNQEWCWVQIGWSTTPTNEAVLRLRRATDIACERYDRFLLSAALPRGTVIQVSLESEIDTHTSRTDPSTGEKREYAIPIDELDCIRHISLSIYPGDSDIHEGWLNWIGLQSSTRLADHLAQWECFDGTWDEHLVPVGVEPSFCPTLGIVVDGEQLNAIRSAGRDTSDRSPFRAAAAAAEAHEPESMIGEYLRFWTDDRYCRDRDLGCHLIGRGPNGLGHGANAAIAGLVFEDHRLLRLAARYALCIATVDHWDDGMVANFPGSAWEHRCFVQSLALHDVAFVLDLAGELFTDTGRSFLRRRLAQEGLGSVTYNTWKYDYIFSNNQLAWFSHGRLLALAVLEAEWPRVASYTDIAYEELCSSLDQIILNDGGYVEGPTYFDTVVRHGGRALAYYARLRGEPLDAVVPTAFTRTEPFAAALVSTDRAQDVIPICDGSDTMSRESLALLTHLMPKGAWMRLLMDRLNRTGPQPNTIFEASLRQAFTRPDDLPLLPPVVHLPDMNVAASHRMHNGQPVKCFLMGNRAGAGHTHEDKGSFVIEYAGDTFAMDPGITAYGSPVAIQLKQCQRHNMLVPTGTDDRPHPENPLPADVTPIIEATEATFAATIDCAFGWEKYYDTWIRQVNYPSPDYLEITDNWSLSRGDGVQFLWQTEQAVKTDGKTAILTGRHGSVHVESTGSHRPIVESVSMPDGSAKRITFLYPHNSGEETITVRFM